MDYFNDVYIKVNNIVREYRKKLNISLDSLAEITGLSQSTISAIENGSSCSVKSALLLSMALNVPVDDLFFLYFKI